MLLLYAVALQSRWGAISSRYHGVASLTARVTWCERCKRLAAFIMCTNWSSFRRASGDASGQQSRAQSAGVTAPADWTALYVVPERKPFKCQLFSGNNVGQVLPRKLPTVEGRSYVHAKPEFASLHSGKGPCLLHDSRILSFFHLLAPAADCPCALHKKDRSKILLIHSSLDYH